MLYEWSALRKEHSFPSLIGTVEFKKVSDKYTMSKLWFLMNVSTDGILIKSWAAVLYLVNVIGPRFSSMTLEKSKTWFR